MSRFADQLQELRELGLGGTVFRIGWEARQRTGAARFFEPTNPLEGFDGAALETAPTRWCARLPFADPGAVADVMRDRASRAQKDELTRLANEAASGRIHAFGRWTADYGQPLDWHLNPTNGERWPAELHWSRVLAHEPRVGDVKLTWEVARFPHAYWMARAAAYAPGDSERHAGALVAQFESFERDNPYPLGVHWASGQETAFRLFAWLFGLDALVAHSGDAARAGRLVARALAAGAAHIEAHIEYAQHAVYNNHLISEGLGLYVAGILLNGLSPHAPRWRAHGRAVLDAEAVRQFYPDGAYIQQSHNYHRLALQLYLLALAFARIEGSAPAATWTTALTRSLDFLHAQQNPADGRLPNFGANDGARPMLLASSDFGDFRAVLQTVSLATRGERLYEPGPWDEYAAWLLGPVVLEAPLVQRQRTSVSFAATGYHVLRAAEPGTFTLFRCGTVRDRFAQIDMLHADLWWRGHNVLVDGGSYLYNGAPAWHDHFVRTASHNTVTVDGLDQMQHHRRFKTLYWTEASLLELQRERSFAVVAGEHTGYRRHPGGCVHRRSILFVEPGAWIVADTVRGEGEHEVRLHWLGGAFHHRHDEARGSLVLATPAGELEVQLVDLACVPLATTCVQGQASPPRGWQSRYYGQRDAVPSLATEARAPLPVTWLSVIGPVGTRLAVRDGAYTLVTSGAQASFGLDDGRFTGLRVE